jgi:hypothetical protein
VGQLARSPGRSLPTRPSTTEKEVEFDRETQWAVISSTENGEGRIVIDNFLTINDQDKDRGGVSFNVQLPRASPPQQYNGSCFGEPPNRDRPPVQGEAIDTALTRIGPVEVSRFLASGTIRFTLWDYGAISGSTELWLVIRRRACPESSLEGCQARAGRDFDARYGQCAEEFTQCVEQDRGACQDRRDVCEDDADRVYDIDLEVCGRLCSVP